MKNDQKLDFFSRFVSQHTPGTAKYALLRNAMLKAIESGYWAPGEKLPTENDITGATPFSLGTVQRALRELTDEGLIVRRQGHGSFVVGPRKAMDKPWHCRFLNDDASAFLPIFAKVLLVERVNEYGPWSPFLEQKGDNIIRIDRRISINHEFSVYSRFYTNADKFGSLLEKPIPELESANLKYLLNQNFNLPITLVSQNLRILEFSDDVCKKIEARRGTIGLHIEAIASAGKTIHLYYQEWFIPKNDRTLRIVENSPLDDIL